MARQLAPGVWLLELAVPVVGANAFLVDDGEVTLVDAGLPRFGVRRELRDAGYDASDIDRVLVTHYDIDHIGGLRDLPFRDPPVFVGERGADLLAGTYDPPLFHHKGAFHRLARQVVSITDPLRRAPRLERHPSRRVHRLPHARPHWPTSTRSSVSASSATSCGSATGR